MLEILKSKSGINGPDSGDGHKPLAIRKIPTPLELIQLMNKKKHKLRQKKRVKLTFNRK